MILLIQYPYLNEDQIDQYTATEIESRENCKKYKFIEYHKWTFNGAWYTSLIGNLVLAAKVGIRLPGILQFGYRSISV